MMYPGSIVTHNNKYYLVIGTGIEARPLLLDFDGSLIPTYSSKLCIAGVRDVLYHFCSSPHIPALPQKNSLIFYQNKNCLIALREDLPGLACFIDTETWTEKKCLSIDDMNYLFYSNQFTLLPYKVIFYIDARFIPKF